MERRSALLNFTLRIKASLLHELLQRVAERAYSRGYEDAQGGHPQDPARVSIDPSQVRKLQ